MTFEDFFREVTGFPEPFDWQTRLVEQLLQSEDGSPSWPDVCALPTSAGKTSLLLIAIYVLAQHPNAHRRIAYVIDRRIVADEAFNVARRLKLP